MANLPPNIRLTVSHIEQKKATRGTIFAYVKRTRIAFAKYLIKKKDNTMKVIAVDVDEEWQRRGIGTLLSNLLKILATGHGCKRIILLALWDTGAGEFWEKQGFKYYQAPNFMEFIPQDLNIGLRLKE
jgi:GNAT superfamily N-acetyltransferase